jgi:hypothetical protein
MIKHVQIIKWVCSYGILNLYYHVIQLEEGAEWRPEAGYIPHWDAARVDMDFW